MAETTQPLPKVPKDYPDPSYIGRTTPYVAPKYYTQGMLEEMEKRADPDYVPNKWNKPVDIFANAASIGKQYEGFLPTVKPDVDGIGTIGYGGKVDDPKYRGLTNITKELAHAKMIETYKERDSLYLKKYPAYRAMNPNEKAGFLDFAYSLKNLNTYTDLSYYLKDPKNIPQIINIVPAFRKVNDVISEGKQRRNSDDMRLMLEPSQDKEYLPIFIKGKGY